MTTGMLPHHLPPSSLPGREDEPHAVPIGVDERLEPVLLDLFGEDRNLLVLGDAGCGKSNLLRLVVQGLIARHTPDEVVFAVVDPRRTLHDVVPDAYLADRGMLKGGAPDDPRIVVVVDDHHPESLVEFLTFIRAGEGHGLYFVVAGRTLDDPAPQAIREAGTTTLVMSTSQPYPPHDPGPQPPGRGLWIPRGGGERLVQIAFPGTENPAPAPPPSWGNSPRPTKQPPPKPQTPPPSAHIRSEPQAPSRLTPKASRPTPQPSHPTPEAPRPAPAPPHPAPEASRPAPEPSRPVPEMSRPASEPERTAPRSRLRRHRTALNIGVGVVLGGLVSGVTVAALTSGGDGDEARGEPVPQASAAPSTAPAPPVPAPEPTTPVPSPSSSSRIDSETTDAERITVTEIFPWNRITLGGRAFQRDREQAVTCDTAADGAMSGALTAGGCRTVVRARYVDAAQGLTVTVGVAAMPDLNAARTANASSVPADPRNWFRALDDRPAPGQGTSIVKGRYVLYALAARSDGKPAADAGAALSATAGDFLGQISISIDARARR
ncbi:FtsK/SpoIIIE domain-containing protein [Spirillospora sp. CA-294931]|uniref:FtsK/SpoIIIE domain-containing protein n=1 Tax=Spirillospora sp. CA-294931 TaxID=3240042 RepID=UPI003D90CEB3